MRFLLDTNAVIALVKQEPIFMERARSERLSDLAIPSIALHELYFGAFKSRRVEANLDRIDYLQLQVVEFDREDAREAGTVRAGLAGAGTPIGPYDVLIAGQALARGLIVVTSDAREFMCVTGLQVENWERPG